MTTEIPLSKMAEATWALTPRECNCGCNRKMIEFCFEAGPGVIASILIDPAEAKSLGTALLEFANAHQH